MTDQRAGSFASRQGVAHLFRFIEEGFYVAIALALAIAGALLFGDGVVSFITDLDGSNKPFATLILELLDTMLLVFIFSELIHTVSAVISENVLKSEPFLIVGIVAAIRRLVVISAEAKSLVGEDKFTDLLTEMGILTLSVLLLGATIFLLRRSSGGHQAPAGESPA